MFMIFYHLTLAISFFIAFTLFVFITRGRRPISSILAWLFFIFLLPFAGIPFFILFGSRKLGWVIDKKREIYLLNRCQRDSAHTQALLDMSGVLPTREGNRIEYLFSGEHAYSVILSHIQQAQHSILISTYLIGNDPVGEILVNALVEKAQNGVQVFLLLDTVGSLFKYPRRKLKNLNKAGGRVRFIMPLLHLPFRGSANLRDHRKIMIFDAKHAIIGGMNLAEEYMGPTPLPSRWSDLSMMIEGPAVPDLLSIFESDWEFAGSWGTQKSYQCPPHNHNISAGNSTLQMLASGPDTIGDRLYDEVISAIYHAKKNITIITPYFILDDGLQKAFMIALRRGVEVNIILPKKSNHPVTDAVRSISVRKLRGDGANIWFYPTMIHTKAMKFDDDLAIVGSANLDLRSLLLNFEISCFIRSTQDIQTLGEWMEHLQSLCSKKYKKLTVWRMLKEDAMQILKPLL